jgi:hypothetical protein
MKNKRWKLLCVGMVALLVLGLVESSVAVSQQAHKGDNSGLNGQALGNGQQQEQGEQQTQNAGNDKTIQNQRKEEVRAMNNGSNGLAPGQVKKEIPQLAAITAPITVLHKAQGFALNESRDEYHVLTTSIIRVRRVQPMRMRDLMEANKSIEDIKAEITEAD